MNRIIGRLSAALLATSLVAIASPAWAHVHVDSDDATQGGFGVATFRVPNESDSLATTKITVTLPADAPFASVSAESKPGWKVSSTTRTITWTATGQGIAPDQFDTFGLSAGPFPAADELVLPVTQTYADGEVIAWDQEQTGDTEPERPAPVLTVTAADTDKTSATTGSSSNGTALTVAIAAAVVAAAALLVSVRQNRTRA